MTMNNNLKQASVNDKDITNSEVVKSYYDILDKDVDTTKEIPKGFSGLFVFIEGDVKDLRIFCLN